MSLYSAKDLQVIRTDGTVVRIWIGNTPIAIVLDAEGARWLMRKLGEALLAPVEPTVPAQVAPPMRSDEVLLVRRMHRASWCRELEPTC